MSTMMTRHYDDKARALMWDFEYLYLHSGGFDLVYAIIKLTHNAAVVWFFLGLRKNQLKLGI